MHGRLSIGEDGEKLFKTNAKTWQKIIHRNVLLEILKNKNSARWRAAKEREDDFVQEPRGRDPGGEVEELAAKAPRTDEGPPRDQEGGSSGSGQNQQTDPTAMVEE